MALSNDERKRFESSGAYHATEYAGLFGYAEQDSDKDFFTDCLADWFIAECSDDYCCTVKEHAGIRDRVRVFVRARVDLKLNEKLRYGI